MTTETAGPVERWAIEHGVSLPHPDNQNSTVQVMLDCVMLNSLITFARQHDERTAALVEALKRIADSPEGDDTTYLACAGAPFCTHIGTHGHADSCPVGVARAALAAFKEEA